MSKNISLIGVFLCKKTNRKIWIVTRMIQLLKKLKVIPEINFSRFQYFYWSCFVVPREIFTVSIHLFQLKLKKAELFAFNLLKDTVSHNEYLYIEYKFSTNNETQTAGWNFPCQYWKFKLQFSWLVLLFQIHIQGAIKLLHKWQTAI